MVVSTPLTSRLLKVFQWHTLNVSSDKWCNALLDHWCCFRGALGFIKASTQHFFLTNPAEQQHLRAHKVMWSHFQVLTNWQKQIARSVSRTILFSNGLSGTLVALFAGERFPKQQRAQGRGWNGHPKGLGEPAQVRPRALDLPCASRNPAHETCRWIYMNHEQNGLQQQLWASWLAL